MDRLKRGCGEGGGEQAEEEEEEEEGDKEKRDEDVKDDRERVTSRAHKMSDDMKGIVSLSRARTSPQHSTQLGHER